MERRKTGHIDLEAVEMLVRTAMHEAGAATLTPLPFLLRSCELQQLRQGGNGVFPVPAATKLSIRSYAPSRF